MKTFSLLLTIVFFSACGSKQSQVDKENISQVSYHHGILGKDSIVLIGKNDIGNFEEIQIFREKQKIFDHTDKNLEIIGTPLNFFNEQTVKTYSEYFYVFKLFNAPSPDKFLVIKTTKEQTILFGITDSNTSEIFGDIDYDGKFEIGGWIDYCQEGGPKECPDLNLFTVFEIDENFPTDTVLTKFFKGLIKKK